MVHPKVSKEKQLITVFAKRSRRSKESEALRVEKAQSTMRLDRYENPSLPKANFSGPMGTQKENHQPKLVVFCLWREDKKDIFLIY